MKDHAILLIDGRDIHHQDVVQALRSNDYIVHLAQSGAEAIDIIQREAIDVILLDLMISDMSPVLFLQELRQRQSESGVIILSDANSVDLSLEALRSGAIDFIIKPIRMSELEKAISRTLRLSMINGLLKAAEQDIEELDTEMRNLEDNNT